VKEKTSSGFSLDFFSGGGVGMFSTGCAMRFNMGIIASPRLENSMAFVSVVRIT